MQNTKTWGGSTSGSYEQASSLSFLFRSFCFSLRNSPSSLVPRFDISIGLDYQGTEGGNPTHTSDLDSSNRRRVEEKRRIWGLRG
jgi:hypothetical protein